MDNDKKDNLFEVHRLTGAMSDVHRAYGLWIGGGMRGSVSMAGGFAVCPKRYFEFYSLSHMYDGGGRFWTPDGGEVEIAPGDALLLGPKVVHRYGGGADTPYIEDAVKFNGPVADMLLRSRVIGSGVYHLGPVRKLPAVIELAQDPSPRSQIEANIALQKILFELYESKRRDRRVGVIERVLQLLKEDSSHWYQVSELAELCDMSEDRLRRMFVRHTRMNPKEYMERVKLHQAAERLLSGSETVREIAERFGYLDPFHFSRRFKLFSGFSPADYRRVFGARRID